MRDAIGGAWILGIIMVFMMFMIAFVYVSIDYNHVYKTKTEIVHIIEQYQGINAKSRTKIQKNISGNGYIGMSKCNLKAVSGENTKVSKKFICYYKGGWNTYSKSGTHAGETCQLCITSYYYPQINSSTYDEYYYNVEIFLKVDLPVVGRIANFRITGSTNAVYYPYSNPDWDYQ